MAFTGTWQVYHEENLDEYLKELGKVKPVFVIEQDGENFTFTIKTPAFTKVQKFSIGKETEFTTVDGRKYKCTIRVEDGKLIAENEKFTSVREIQGDEMIEVSGKSTLGRDWTRRSCVN
uniref:Fatty acid binding protein 10b, liver basic n=1 Tax=Mastacembelus armatus TaxID=205130 RepID=A0A3Q3LMK4_9TELE